VKQRGLLTKSQFKQIRVARWNAVSKERDGRADGGVVIVEGLVIGVEGGREIMAAININITEVVFRIIHK